MSTETKALLFVLAVATAGCVIVVLTAKSWLHEEHLYSAETIGTLVTNEQGETRDEEGDRRHCWMPIVSYRVDGQTFRHRGDCLISSPWTYRARVPIRYDPTHPSTATIGTFQNMHSGHVGFGVVGGLLCLAGGGPALGILIIGAQRARRRQRA